jgi:aspartate/methionine/tyrosine aminotransferase
VPDEYYENMARDYQKKRDMLASALAEAGFKPFVPQGSYYMLADVSKTGARDDRDATVRLLEEAKVAVVPGSSFYPDPAEGKMQVRLCYAKKMPDLEEACRRLRAFTR